MDFDFINDIRKLLQGYNIFSYTLDGIKILALAFIILKAIQILLKNSTEEKFNYTQLVRIGGYILLVSSFNYIIDLFENLFSVVDNFISVKESDVYTKIIFKVEKKFEESNSMSGWNLMTKGTDMLLFFIEYIIFIILAMLCKIADLSITASYLLQRLFIIELLKFLLPVAVVMSFWEKWENMLMSWLKRYFGVLVLGLAYVGIINFIDLVCKSIMNQFNVYGEVGELSAYMFGSIIAVIVCFTTKVKLFSVATSYIQGYFS
jgi:membrane protein